MLGSQPEPPVLVVYSTSYMGHGGTVGLLCTDIVAVVAFVAAVVVPQSTETVSPSCTAIMFKPTT